MSYFYVILAQQTDSSVVAEDGEAVVKFWYDLGNGFSIEVPSWQSHLHSDQDRIFRNLQFNC